MGDINKRLGGIPLPNKPKLSDLADTTRWIDAMYDYLRRLIYTVSGSAVSGDLLPAVPDTSKDWYLEFIAADNIVEWYQKPDIYHVIPVVNDVHEVEPDKSLGNITWFSGGATMKAGQYVIGYESGALDYGGDVSDAGVIPSPTGVYHLNHSDLHAYFMVYQNANLYGLLDPAKNYGDRICQDYDHAGLKISGQIAQYYGPGYGRINWNAADDHFGFDNTFGEQYGVEAAFAGQYVVINHDGSGPIGMRLYDYPRHDNVAMPAGTLPKFYLAPLWTIPYYRLAT